MESGCSLLDREKSALRMAKGPVPALPPDHLQLNGLDAFNKASPLVDTGTVASIPLRTEENSFITWGV